MKKWLQTCVLNWASKLCKAAFFFTKTMDLLFTKLILCATIIQVFFERLTL
jgi:hypothetical protein